MDWNGFCLSILHESPPIIQANWLKAIYVAANTGEQTNSLNAELAAYA